MKEKYNRRLVLFIFLLGLFLLLGCNNSIITYSPATGNNSTDNLRTFITSNKSLLHFSFAYPFDFGLTDESKGNANPSLSVKMLGQTEAIELISIDITNYSPKWLGFPNAEITMKEQLSEYKWSLNRNYRMLEKHKCVVDGIEGWETVVTFRERLLPIAKYREPRDAMAIVARDLFFDYQGMTWQISIYCEKELYEKQAKNDFEGILHSFKFSE